MCCLCLCRSFQMEFDGGMKAQIAKNTSQDRGEGLNYCLMKP